MQKPINLTLSAAAAILLAFAVRSTVQSHCEIPCGIYGDRLRLELVLEDVTTIEKSMQEINKLKADKPQDVNQLVRWVTNKDEHAVKVQSTVSGYFITQRVKPAAESDAAAYKKYITQLTSLHQVLIHATKTKQTVDLAHCESLRKSLGQFAEAYFSAEDLKHVEEHQPKK